MNAPHNKNKKKRYLSRKNDVFGDLAVPSLHDVTLKMHNVIDRADNAMLSFKPINYKRIHKRWRNKKYKVVSGGGGGADEKIAEVKKGIGKLTGDVDALTGKVAEIEKADATASPDVAPKDDECLDPKAQRIFKGSLQADNTIRIFEVKPGTYDAFIDELAAIEAKFADGADDDVGADGLVKDEDGADGVVKDDDDDKVVKGDAKTTLATTVDAAAAVAGAAGAAAAAALFSDDHTPVIPKSKVIAKVDDGEPLDWTGLKTRWIKIHTISNPKYQEEMKQNASTKIAIERRVVYDWLINEPLNRGNQFFLNSGLYEAILKWLIKWDEFGGKIRTIVSVRGGQETSMGNIGYYPVIDGKENYNKTKVVLKFKSQKEPDQITRIRKTIGIEGQNDYGYFYTGFSGDDDNLTRYNQGNFKDMITTLEGGGNVGIFGYGYSGSGKTYTLTNYELNDPNANGIAIQLIDELKKAGYKIGLTVTELYCKDVNIVGGKINISKKDLRHYTSVENVDVDRFIEVINNVKLRRINDGHIKYTLNNPESSRGHLFYTFTLKKTDKNPGKLIICDMGGRENPIELSETSYMITEDDWFAKHKSDTMRPVMDENGKERILIVPKTSIAVPKTNITCKNESYVGQIAERIGNDMLRFYVKDPNDDTKWLKNPRTDNLIFQHIKLEFVEGKKDNHDNPVGKNAKRITGAFIKGSETSKCDSLLKSTFGSFFMTPSKKIDENYVRTRLEITKDVKKVPGVAQSESDVVTKITKSLNSFIDCCKEGMYINETINHLVAYVNFLSNVGEYLNNIEVETLIISNDRVSGLATPQSVYHSERHIYDPRAVIKKMYESNLKTIMKDTSFINITKSDDTVGIITELNQIKNPRDDKTSPSMLCFIACISSDNLQPKNKIATQNTLEFAMSVSASNGPPENVVVVPTKAKPETKNQKLPKIEEPLNNFYTRADIIRKAATQKLDKLIKLGKSADDKIAAIINFVRRDEDETLSEYEGTLSKNQQDLPNYQDHYERIYKAFIAYYIAKGPTLGISNVLSSYKKKSNRELVQSVIKAGGAKTRKRESRREKKNRMTRRRNRV